MKHFITILSCNTHKVKMLLLFFLCISVLIPTSLAQNVLNFGTNISSGSRLFPLNGRLGLGASLEYTHKVFKNGHLRGYLAYDRFAHKVVGRDPRVVQDSILRMGIDGHYISFIPLRVGYQQFVFKDQLFLYAEGGMAYLCAGFGNWDPIFFTCAIGTGYRITVQKSNHLQFSLLYNRNRINAYNFKRNYLTARVAYGLSFTK